jgi:hypothetical protein
MFWCSERSSEMIFVSTSNSSPGAGAGICVRLVTILASKHRRAEWAEAGQGQHRVRLDGFGRVAKARGAGYPTDARLSLLT